MVETTPIVPADLSVDREGPRKRSRSDGERHSNPHPSRKSGFVRIRILPDPLLPGRTTLTAQRRSPTRLLATKRAPRCRGGGPCQLELQPPRFSRPGAGPNDRMVQRVECDRRPRQLLPVANGMVQTRWRSQVFRRRGYRGTLRGRWALGAYLDAIPDQLTTRRW